MQSDLHHIIENLHLVDYKTYQHYTSSWYYILKEICNHAASSPNPTSFKLMWDMLENYQIIDNVKFTKTLEKMFVRMLYNSLSITRDCLLLECVLSKLQDNKLNVDINNIKNLIGTSFSKIDYEEDYFTVLDNNSLKDLIYSCSNVKILDILLKYTLIDEKIISTDEWILKWILLHNTNEIDLLTALSIAGWIMDHFCVDILSIRNMAQTAGCINAYNDFIKNF